MTATDPPSKDMTVKEARDYVAHFAKHVMPGATFVQTNAGIIEFDGMTDDEALFVAKGLQAIEKEAARRTLKRGVRRQ